MREGFDETKGQHRKSGNNGKAYKQYLRGKCTGGVYGYRETGRDVTILEAR